MNRISRDTGGCRIFMNAGIKVIQGLMHLHHIYTRVNARCVWYIVQVYGRSLTHKTWKRYCMTISTQTGTRLAEPGSPAGIQGPSAAPLPGASETGYQPGLVSQTGTVRGVATRGVARGLDRVRLERKLLERGATGGSERESALATARRLILSLILNGFKKSTLRAC